MASKGAGTKSGSRSRSGSSKGSSDKSGSGRKGSSSSSRRSSNSRSSNGRGSSSRQRSNQEYQDYSIIDPEDIDEAVDVYVDVPTVQVNEIEFEMDDLRAHVAVLAEAGHFVQLNVGAAVRLGKVELNIQGVETQALLEARLHNVTAILGRVLTSLDRNPELLESVGQALGDVGGGAHDMLGDTGEVVKSAGKGAGSAVQEVGRGAGKGVEGLGQGAQQGVEGLGQGGQQAAGSAQGGR